MKQIKLDAYVLDVLLRDLTGQEKKPAALVVYLFLWQKTAGVNPRCTSLSLHQLADGTGLSKSGVHSALKLLLRRRLLRVERTSPTAVPHYTLLRPWAAPG